MKTLGFGGMLMLCGALAACSSSSTDGAGGSGTGGGDGGGDDGSGGTTSAPSATGTTTATTTGSPTAGPSTGSGGTTCGADASTEPVCNTCLGSECCAEVEACFLDETGACFDAEGALDETTPGGEALVNCLVASCGEECGAGGGGGVCESGISFANPDDTPNEELNGCLTDSCCDEFKACTADGADVNACIACLQAEGEPGELCAAALACADENCFSDICDTGIGFGDKAIDDCLSTACCDEYTACVGTTDAEADACLACLLSDAGGELCNAAISCTTESGCVPAEM